MITNANITIYNRKYNKTTRLYEWKGTQIQNVHWFNDLKMELQSGAVESADIFKVRIPLDAIVTSTYVDASEYKALTDTTGKWTIQKDDIIAYGLINDQITGLATLTDKSIKSFKIMSYSVNLRGSLPHYRVGGS